uniref:Lectizyme n=1 Tax=Glossina palpalis gambiensis TaxID=67801 RepID=A0A1B0AMK2_9MUSC
MYKLLSLLAALVSVCGASRSCNVQFDLNGCISSGNITNARSFPYRVSILHVTNRFRGTGVIYNRNIIITAAHVVSGVTPSELKVRAGSSSWNKDGILIQVVRYHLHAKFNPKNRAHDIALIQLVNNFIYNTQIKPIPLAIPLRVNATGYYTSAASALGWCPTDKTANNKDPFSLISASSALMNPNECHFALVDSSFNEVPIICAEIPTNDACIVDYGAPLVSDGSLLGLGVKNAICVSGKCVALYTNVSYFQDWIHATAKVMN